MKQTRSEFSGRFHVAYSQDQVMRKFSTRSTNNQPSVVSLSNVSNGTYVAMALGWAVATTTTANTRSNIRESRGGHSQSGDDNKSLLQVEIHLECKVLV